MRRSIWIFLAAIFLPSLGLAWLAIHSVRDQQVVLEHQQAIICQGMTDALSKNIQSQMDSVREDFQKTTQLLLDHSSSPQALAENFNPKLREAWPQADVGFAVDLNGKIYSPQSSEDSNAKTFRNENDRFLSNRENVEVYSQNAVQSTASLTPAKDEETASAKFASFNEDKSLERDSYSIQRKETQVTLDDAKKRSDAAGRSLPGRESAAQSPPEPDADVPKAPQAPAPRAAAPSIVTTEDALTNSTPAPPAAPTSTATGGAPSTVTTSAAIDASSTAQAPSNSPVDSNISNALARSNQQYTKTQRNVIPQQTLTRDTAALSNTVPEESDFRRVIGSETSGALARFLENNLRLLVWSHPAGAPSIVFGAELDKAKLIEILKVAFSYPPTTPDSLSRSSEPTTCLAILDDSGHPVALSIPGFASDWKHPFVATEIGEVLPHWEAALYLVDPRQISRSARTLQLTLGLIVLLLVAAIVSGGSLIAADVRRQIRLAQQKTDFVSNVSHELKTPLTSIRMFADLLAEKRVPDEARQRTYLRIIAAESARLTRLINNVLDFARLERGAPPGEHRPCDLVDAARDVIETCQPHLESSEVSLQHEIEAESLPLSGDRDALSQIILNLVSNAEKYGGKEILVRVRHQETSAGSLGCVDVLDRGSGIPLSQVKTIFEPFHRLDDSLASGIPGSGLGLTLARRMARAHGGDVTYSPRAGGGSCFTLSIPLTVHPPAT
jgi:signal transduction histidine kinase